MKNLEITFGSGFLEECPEILNMNVANGNDFDLTLKQDLKTHGYDLACVRYANHGDGCFLWLNEDLPDRKEEKEIWALVNRLVDNYLEALWRSGY